MDDLTAFQSRHCVLCRVALACTEYGCIWPSVDNFMSYQVAWHGLKGLYLME